MDILKILFIQFIIFSSGVVIAGGVFAFIATIGVVPRLAGRTKTQKYIRWYETCIIIGGIFGTSTMFIDYYLPLGTFFVIVFSLCIGIFIGCFAVSLAEVLDVIPILGRRGNVSKGLSFFMLAIAFGKLTGSIIYYVLPGFYFR